MIVTVTLNPAIDKTYDMDNIEIGHVGRINRATQFAGGKGINVTRMLRQYDFPVTAMGFIGGYTGKYIENEVIKCGAKAAFTYVSENTRTNTNIITKDGLVTEILEPGPVISQEEMQKFLCDYTENIKNCNLIVISGSLPKGIPSNFYYTLIDIAKKSGKRVILDSSSDALANGIEAAPFMIKPNIYEIEKIYGKKLDSTKAVIEAAEYYRKRGIDIVVISMGEKGFIHVDCENRIQAIPAKIKVANTVSCGDSIVAAYVMGLTDNKTANEIVKKAAAISCAVATNFESGNIPIETADKIYEHVELSTMNYFCMTPVWSIECQKRDMPI